MLQFDRSGTAIRNAELVEGTLGSAHRADHVRRMSVLGVPIACLDMAGLVEEIDRYLAARTESGPGTFVCFRDVHGVVLAQDSRTLMQAHHDALLVVADGKPLSVLARLSGNRDIRQVRGIDSVPALCRAGCERGWRHYFLGGAPGVAEDLAAEMSSRFPGLIVVGTESPPYRQITEGEKAVMVERINRARPDLIWVGLGSPKQELWMADIAPRLRGAICLGVGAAFDVHTGRIAHAPAWVRRIGLEWAFRITQEPRRLAGRYLHAIPRFLALVALAAVSGNGPRLQRKGPFRGQSSH